MANGDEWAAYLGLNPDDIEPGQYIDSPGMTKKPTQPKQKRTRKPAKAKSGSSAEDNFLAEWNRHGDDKFPITQQFKYDPNRRFSADFAFKAQFVLVEVDGMVGKNNHVGHHRSWPGFMSDRKRDLNAAKLGYLTIRIPTPWLKPGTRDYCAPSVIADIVAILRYR